MRDTTELCVADVGFSKATRAIRAAIEELRYWSDPVWRLQSVLLESGYTLMRVSVTEKGERVDLLGNWNGEQSYTLARQVQAAEGEAVEHILKAILDHSAAYMLSSSTEGRELMSDRLSKHP